MIPGGIYGHMTPALVAPGASPFYAQRGEGCRYWDVDGNEYLDFMCAYGPVVLGYLQPEVEEAVARQLRAGDCFNHPGSVMVELAEQMVELVDFAAWAVFAKNGSDVTSWSIRVAREHTGRRKVLVVDDAYHGMDPWCSPGHGGLIEEDRVHVHTFEWNDVDDLDAALERHADDVAAVMITPYHHPMYRDSVLPADGFLAHLREQCDRYGIVLILDDVRAGFRLHLGGSHRCFGIPPDLSCYSKAMANGYPIAAALGRPELRRAATQVFLTGSFWNSAVPMAAARATLRVLERDGVPEHLSRMGEMLGRGLESLAARHGLQITVSGPPAIPFLTFSNETDLYRSQHFAAECIARGLFVHPHHNWFLSAAHQPEDIEQALSIADEAFASVKARFGS